MASTGVIWSKDLPFTTNNKMIKTFRHALALDEHRAKFVPEFWHIPPGMTRNTPMKRGATTRIVGLWDKALFEVAKQVAKKVPKKNLLLHMSTISNSESNAAIKAETEPDVREVWFVGVHSGKCKVIIVLAIH